MDFQVSSAGYERRYLICKLIGGSQAVGVTVHNGFGTDRRRHCLTQRICITVGRKQTGEL